MIHCLIVDDEPIARALLETYCRHLPMLQVVASCAHALEARAILLQRPIDLLFLDIHLPILDGMSFLKTLKHPPSVIFTTAYPDYAVNAFELSASDYLVKPFSLERFIVAVDKIVERLAVVPVPPPSPVGVSSTGHIFIKTDGRLHKLRYEALLFVESQGNSTRLVMVDGEIQSSMSFASLEELLPKPFFSRSHRSFLINISAITQLEGNRVFVGRYELPIGRLYRSSFLNILGL